MNKESNTATMLHALIQNTSATSITASKVPAIAGPAMRERFRTALSTATALATWFSGTKFGTRELRTGVTTAIKTERSVTTTANSQNGLSAASKYPTQIVGSMIPACSRINSFRRSLRSASTPAGTLSKKVGTRRQALIKPRYNAEPVNSRTAQFKATRVIHSPVWLTRFPTAKIPKDRDRRAKRVGEKRTSARVLGFKFISTIGGPRPTQQLREHGEVEAGVGQF